MDDVSYRRELLIVLRRHSGQALETLRTLEAAMPEAARSLQFLIHLGQEQDGTFSIMAHLDGPDLFALNNVIKNCRILFDVRYAEGGVEPDVPLFDPFNPPFEVGRVIAEAGTAWIEELWHELGGMQIPASVAAEDGCGVIKDTIPLQA